MRLIYIFMVGLILTMLASCTSYAPVDPHYPVNQLEEGSSLQPIINSRYKILPGDDLEIKLTYHPTFNERVIVLPDGWITLPLVNNIQATGKTPDEFAAELKQAYQKELRNPEVVVMVRQSNGRIIYIGGEVKLPRAIPLNFPTTLLQAVIQSGGTLPSAKEKTVLILRAVPGAPPIVMVVNLAKIKAGAAADIPLEPYDIVHVPKTVIAQTGDFVDAYINRILPKNVTFPFTYEIHADNDW